MYNIWRPPWKGSDLVFAIGDSVVYGYEGVFVISDYTTSPIDKEDKRVFYVLRPMFGSGNSMIVTPSEGGATPIRAVITKEQAEAVIDRACAVGEVEVSRERNRREVYREVMSRCCPESCISIIKTVRRRRKEFFAQKRRLSETDTDFETRARHCLFSELAYALGVTFAEAEQAVLAKLNEA